MVQIKGGGSPAFLLVALLLMICAPGVSTMASAQPAAGARALDPREEAKMRFGFFYVTPTISIDQFGIDSNVFNSADDPKSDFTVSLTPRATVWVPFARRALLTTDIAVGFVYYKSFESQRSVNPSLNLQGEVYARRLTFFGEAGKSRSFAPPNSEIETRVEQINENLGAGVRFNIQRGLTVGLSTYHQATRLGSDAVFLGVVLKDTLDRVEQGVRLTVQEKLTSLTTVGLIVESRLDRFDQSPDRDADGYRVAATVHLAPKALVSGDVEIGFRHLKPNDPLVPIFNGLVAKVAVSNRLPGSLQTRLGWDRDLHYSYDTSQPYYLSNALSVSLRRQLVGQFDVSVAGIRSRGTSRALLGPVLVDGRRYLTTVYSVDVGYRLSRDARVGFALSRVNRSSAAADVRQYGATRAGLSLNYGF